MTLTLPNISPESDTALRQKAWEQHLPVEQVAVDAIKAGLAVRDQRLEQFS